MVLFNTHAITSDDIYMGNPHSTISRPLYYSSNVKQYGTPYLLAKAEVINGTVTGPAGASAADKNPVLVSLGQDGHQLSLCQAEVRFNLRLKTE
jgi:hypothetical protein